MSINEMIKNVKALRLRDDISSPLLHITLSTSVDELTEIVRNEMFERFVSTVKAYSEVCGVSPVESRQFAVDFIKSNDYVEKYLRVTINLVLNGGFSNKSALDGFLNRLLWSHVVEASHKKIGNKKNESILSGTNASLIVIDLWSDDDE